MRLAVVRTSTASVALAAFVAVLLTVQSGSGSPSGQFGAVADEGYGSLPLAFEANRGQTDAQAKFLARGSGYTLFLTSTGPVLAILRPDANESAVIRMRLAGAKPTPAISGLERLPGQANYFVGRDPQRWRTGIPLYGRVRYENVYPGIDLVFHGSQGRLEYDFTVAPRADPGTITLAFDGASGIELDARGDIVLQTEGGSVRQARPILYQAENGDRRRVAGGYVLKGEHEVGFWVGAYDRSKPLVIDPVLVYSTFLGGSGLDEAHSIAVDAAGNAYVTGLTASANFPTAGPIQGLRGLWDAFVTKLNPSGSAVVYSTYLGGGGDEKATGIALDAARNAYLVGRTDSADFPVANAFQRVFRGGVDAFVAKLNATGSALAYSTYLGGSGLEIDHDFDLLARATGGIAVDSAGSAYVTGLTTSPDFPTANPLQPTNAGFDDVFVAKLQPSGLALVFSTYLGGSDNDLSEGIALDASRNAHVAGTTSSSDFPTASPLQRAPAGGFSDAFVTKLSASGAALLYSTYLGGTITDSAGAIAVDGGGSAYLTGSTSSFDFPTRNPFQATKGGDFDAFVSKLNAAGSALVYSTYLGALDDEFGAGIAVDSFGRAHVGGTSSSGTLGCRFANPDAFAVKFDSGGSALVYATCLGGSREDRGLGIALDGSGGAYLTGDTGSSGFPTTPGAFQTVYGGGASDAFVAKILDEAPVVSADLGIAKADSPDPVRVRRNLTYTLAVTNAGPDSATGVTVVDELPAGVRFVSASPSQGSCVQPATSTVNCSLGSLAAGTRAEVTIVVRPTRRGTITNTARVSHSNSDPNSANDTDTEQTRVVR